MSPVEQKINNSYESEPSSGNSNGSSIDTLTMGNHELDNSPKLNTLLGLGLGQLHHHHHHPAELGTPHAVHHPAGFDGDITATSSGSGPSRRVVSEAADRERVELAKIYFQRVFAESQHQQHHRAERAEFEARTPTQAAAKPERVPRGGYGGAGSGSNSRSSSSSNSSRGTTGSNSSASRAANCFSAEISDQDEKCRRELQLQQQLGQLVRPCVAAFGGDDNNNNDAEGAEGADDDNDDDSDDDDDDEEDDLSNVSVYSIEPSSSLDNDSTNNTTNTAISTTSTNPAPTMAMPMAAPPAPQSVPAPNATMPPGLVFVAEHSCNAVDHQIAAPSRAADIGQVSFDGCIRTMSREHEHKLSVLQAERSSSFMQANNEQSPDLFEESDDDGGDDDDDEEEEEEDVVDDADEEDDAVEMDVIDEDDADDVNAEDDKRAHIHASEKIVLGRIQCALSGLLPPPSVTILQYDILEMLSMYKQNSARLADNPAVAVPLQCVDGRSEFRPTHSVEEFGQLEWPHSQDAKAHGVHYNRSECTESIEMLCMRYAERNIGAETASTFACASPSSCKKRSMRLKQLTKSPGNRLSHLARRRAVFSSANLLNKSNANDSSTLGGKGQLVIDTRNRDRRSRVAKVKTPRRRTPGRKTRTPGRKTPGSSRKRLVFGGVAASAAGASSHAASAASAVVAAAAATAAGASGLATLKPLVPATRETSKRALFQSPPQEKPRPQFPADVAHRVERSKRVLFSPLPPSHRKQQSSTCVPQTPDSDAADAAEAAAGRSRALQQHQQQQQRGSGGGGSALRRLLSFGASDAICENSNDTFQAPPKRKRDGDHDEGDDDTAPAQLMGHAAKMPRLASAATINLDNLTPRTMKLAKSQSFSVTAATGSRFRAAAGALQRATSEQAIGSGSPLLSDVHKKKIFWATATALKNKKIGSQHASYTQYASVLAKVIKRFYLELPDRKSEGTSAAMLKIAEKHVFWVLQGKTEDEIYLSEKHRVDQSDVRLPKVTGYVAPEEYELRKSLLMRSRSTSSAFGVSQSASTMSASLLSSSPSASQAQQQQQQQQFSQGSCGSVTASQIAADLLSSQPLSAASIDVGALCTEHRMQLSANKASAVRVAPLNGNSTSKSNTKTGVLRENDQRQRSAQKSVTNSGGGFSGRDQKNLSVSKLAACGSMVYGSAAASGGVGANIMKAKRQISFDS